MTSVYTEKIIMLIGGSLIVPDGGMDTEFLSNLNKFIRKKLAENKNRQFFLVVGGGSTERYYRDAGRDVIGYGITHDDLDWLGIHATRLNAHLIRTIFRDIAYSYIIKHYDVIRKAKEPIVVASGWKPGWSTSFDAVLLCEDYDVKTIINLSNIDIVYDKEPKTNPDAKPIKNIAWADFRKIVGNEWTPEMNVPFDPIASKKAQELGLKVVILKGNNFGNLENYFAGKEFVGTVIED